MRRVRVLHAVLALPFLLILAGAKNADESQPRDPLPETVQGEPPAEGERPVEARDRFEPTERISEDLSVAFPVDI